MLDPEYKPNYAILPDGWMMASIGLTKAGVDHNGWVWGPGLPLWWFANGFDSCTVRAASPVEAITIIILDSGWPPSRTGRINWEYPQA